MYPLAFCRRVRLAISASLSASALLPGCASYEPRPLVPAEELASLSGRSLQGLRIEHARPGERAAEPAAFDPTDGLDEAELVAVALTLNPDLRARRLQVGETEALLITAGLWPNPELGIGVRAGIDDTSSTAVSLDALFALLRPGEREARRGIAEARIDAARAEVGALELDVAARTKRARVEVLAADQDARLLRDEAALREQASTLVHRRKELGEASDLDVLLVDLERAAIQRDLREAIFDGQRARRALDELLGLPATYEVPLAEADSGLAFVVFDDMGDTELDRRLLAGRLELRVGEAEYRRAEEELRLAVARQFPELRLGPAYEKDIEGNESLGLAAGIELPLFDRNQGEIAEKAAARERVRADYVATLHGLRAAAFAARDEVRRARDEVQVQQRDVLPLVEHTESLFDGAFQARELSLVEWITARTRALQARRELLAALVRYSQAVAGLEAATGMPLDRSAGRPGETK